MWRTPGTPVGKPLREMGFPPHDDFLSVRAGHLAGPYRNDVFEHHTIIAAPARPYVGAGALVSTGVSG